MSTPDPRIEAIFHEALERAPAEREAFVLEASGGDESLQREVQRLLIAHEDATAYFEPPNSPELDAEFARLKPEEADEWIGNYKLLQQIGEGGFGVVWMAEQEKPVRRRVALKIIKMGMDTKEVIARFEQERQALAMMDHPNIARVLDAGATPFGRPFFVMELIRGIKITDYCDQAGLEMRERLKLFIHVCHAVQHAHQKGIIHRDLKPSNILVTLNDGEAVPKVIDFGVAKAMQGRLTDKSFFTEFDQMVGTLMYMSPEQAEMTSLDIDTRSDIYALGVLLYELLTGRTPIDSETIEHEGKERIRQIIREVDPLRPSIRIKALTGEELTTTAKRRHAKPAKLSGLIRGDLDWIVMMCLEKERNRRYDSANSLALDIQRHLEGQPVIARPPTYAYLLGRFIRRNKLVASAAAAVAAALIIGAAVSLWQANEAREAGKDTKAFSDFLVKRILTPPRPQGVEGGLGIDITVAQALERAEKELEWDFADRPRAELIAREAIGVTWATLGRYKEAAGQLEKAIERRKQGARSDDPTILNTYNNLGVVYQKTGDIERALPLFEMVWKKRKETLSLDHPDFVLSMNNLAAAYLEADRGPEAVDLYERAIETSKVTFGPDNPYTLKIMSGLARAWRLAGTDNKASALMALPLYQNALDESKKTLGADLPETLTCMNNLGVCLEQAGQIQDALPLYEQAWQLSKDKLRDDHPETLISQYNLANAYRKTGDSERAIALFEEALEKARLKPGADHPDTVNATFDLAVIYEDSKMLEKAIPRYEDVLREREKKLGPDHRETLKVMSYLASAYSEKGRLQDTLRLFTEIYERRKKKLGPENQDTLRSMHALANAYRLMNKFDESLALFQKLLALTEKREPLPNGYPQVSDTKDRIAEILPLVKPK
jgi:eukaryotic-like serine/threonine-protein kinase